MQLHTEDANLFIKLFKPWYQHVYSPHCSPHISCNTTWENLFNDQDVLSLLIISFILITCIYLFDQWVLLWGEIRFKSLLGLKGLIEYPSSFVSVFVISVLNLKALKKSSFDATGLTYFCEKVDEVVLVVLIES